eukprot:2435983-Prymnesium_polylepis.1
MHHAGACTATFAQPQDRRRWVARRKLCYWSALSVLLAFGMVLEVDCSFCFARQLKTNFADERDS